MCEKIIADKDPNYDLIAGFKDEDLTDEQMLDILAEEIEKIQSDAMYEGLRLDRIYASFETHVTAGFATHTLRKMKEYAESDSFPGGVYSPRTDTIVINEKVLCNPALRTLDLRKTIVHEAIHRKMFTEGYGEEPPHGERFQAWCVRYGINYIEAVQGDRNQAIVHPLQMPKVMRDFGIAVTEPAWEALSSAAYIECDIEIDDLLRRSDWVEEYQL